MKPYHWELTWFEAKGDNQIGTAYLPDYIELADIRKMFFLPDDDPCDGCIIVRASQREELNAIIASRQHEIDLNKYDYFVEAVADV